jgi:hypothetical protein
MRKYIQRRQGPELEENGLSIATHSGVEGGGGDDFTCGCREKKEEKRKKKRRKKNSYRFKLFIYRANRTSEGYVPRANQISVIEKGRFKKKICQTHSSNFE